LFYLTYVFIQKPENIVITIVFIAKDLQTLYYENIEFLAFTKHILQKISQNTQTTKDIA